MSVEISHKMMSTVERDTYVGELVLYTYYDRFPNDVPTAKKVFDDFFQLFTKKKLKPIPYKNKTISLHDIDMSDSGYAKLLFWLTDPDLPDRDYAHNKTGVRRTAKRDADEDPVLSAHVLIKIDASQDRYRRYPMTIEKVDDLPRTLTIDLINRAFSDHFAEDRDKKGTKGKVKYIPRAKFEAPYSHTLDGVLRNGGVLKSVTSVERAVPSTTFGDASYPVVENKDVKLSIGNKPTGQKAVDLIKTIFQTKKSKSLKKLTISIDDEYGNPKILPLDIKRNDVLSSFFLKRVTLTGFSTPLGLSEDTFRKDIIDKMKKVL